MPKESRVNQSDPVVFVVFDEFPTSSLLDKGGNIHKARYANFYKLAKRASFYKYNTAVSDATHYAVPSMLTGDFPKKNALPIFDNYQNNYFTLLSSKGYRIINAELVTELCPVIICPGPRLDIAASPFDFLSQKLSHRERGNNNSQRILWRKKFIQNLDFSQPKTAVFLHILIPHYPYTHLPSAQHYDPQGLSDMIPRGQSLPKNNPFLLRSFRQRSLLQTGYADKLLGQIIKKLKKEKVWKESTLVVAGDHGSSFIPGSRRRFADALNSHEVAHTPLFIKTPNQTRGGTREVPSMLIDIMPTIADLLGQSTSGYDGQSLLRPVENRVRKLSSSLGHDFTFTLKDSQKHLRIEAKRLNRHFGSKGLYQLGPDSHLIGKRLQFSKPVGKSVNFHYLAERSRLKVSSLQKVVVGPSIPVGTGMVMAVDRVVVASARVMKYGDENIATFIIRPDLLDGNPSVYTTKRGKVNHRVW